MISRPVVLICLLLLAAGRAHADARAAADWTQSVQSVPRRALVIGVSAYDHATQLVTPRYDVSKMQATFQKLGFVSVNVVPNDDAAAAAGELHVSRTTLVKAVTNFANSLGPHDLAVVYYSGHGVQVNGENYLVPSTGDTNPEIPRLSYVSLNWIMSTLQQRKPSAIIILLDACRADPFINAEREARDVLKVPPPSPPVPIDAHGGLAYPAGPPSTYLISFAAQPLTAAFSRFTGDAADVPSIYTRVLALRLSDTHPLDRALFYTETQVSENTSEALVPNETRSALYQLPLDANLPDPPSAEEEWKLIVGIGLIGTQRSELGTFLKEYPLSRHALAAWSRLEGLGNQPDNQAEHPAAPPPSAPTADLLLGSLQGGRTQDGQATAFVSKTTTLSPFASGSGNQSAKLLEGTKVKVLDILSRGRALVQTLDGRLGYIRGVLQASADQLRRMVSLSFQGSGESANVASWAALIKAYNDLGVGSSAVTIRSGTTSDDNPLAQSAVAHLRALRIRDYLHRLGVPENRIVMISADPTVPTNTATVAVSRVIS